MVQEVLKGKISYANPLHLESYFKTETVMVSLQDVFARQF